MMSKGCPISSETHSIYSSMKPCSEGEPGSLGKVLMNEEFPQVAAESVLLERCKKQLPSKP